MAYSGTAWAHPDLHLPRVALPKFSCPRLSRRARAVLMMGVLASPMFLTDTIGHGIQRLFLTAGQIAAREAPDDAMPAQIAVWQVACIDADAPAARQAHWADFAARHGWARYPEAGAGCFKPDRALFGVLGLKTFGVACPTAVLSVADQRRWVAYAARRGWTAYAQAGEGCVDP